MAKVYVIGTMDTKATELRYAANCVRSGALSLCLSMSGCEAATFRQT